MSVSGDEPTRITRGDDSRRRSCRLAPADRASTPFRAGGDGAGARARDSRLRRVARSRAGLHQPDRPGAAHRPAAAAGDGRPDHAQRASTPGAGRRFRRHLARSRSNPQAGRCAAGRSAVQQPADCRWRDRRRAIERRATRSHGERARTARVRACPPHARTRHGRLPSRSDHARAGPEPRTTRRERYRHADVGRPGKRRHRLGVRVHRTLRTAREHRPDRDRREGHRPVPIGGARQVCGEACGSLRRRPRRDRHECQGRDRPRRRRASVRGRGAGGSRAADGQPGHARDRAGALSGRDERRAAPQPRASRDGNTAVPRSWPGWLARRCSCARSARSWPLRAGWRAGDLEARTGFGDDRGELRELGRTLDAAVAAQQVSHRAIVAAREQAWRRIERRDRSWR